MRRVGQAAKAEALTRARARRTRGVMDGIKPFTSEMVRVIIDNSNNRRLRT